MQRKDRRSGSETRMPRKRFRLEKLEERIAPKGHQNPHTKWVGDGNGGGGSSITISGSTIY